MNNLFGFFQIFVIGELNSLVAKIIIIFEIHLFITLNCYFWLIYIVKCLCIYYPAIIAGISEDKFMYRCRFSLHMISIIISILDQLIISNPDSTENYIKYTLLVHGEFVLNSTRVNDYFGCASTAAAIITVFSTIGK